MVLDVLRPSPIDLVLLVPKQKRGIVLEHLDCAYVEDLLGLLGLDVVLLQLLLQILVGAGNKLKPVLVLSLLLLVSEVLLVQDLKIFAFGRLLALLLAIC